MNGPVICTWSISGTPFMFCRSRSRVKGCSGSSDSADFCAMKRHANFARTGLDRDAGPQARVERVPASPRFVSDILLSSSPPTCARNTRTPSMRDFELVRVLETGHVADDVLQQKNAEFVLAVERKIVMDQDAAASTERQTFDVIALREIRRNLIHLG